MRKKFLGIALLALSATVLPSCSSGNKGTIQEGVSSTTLKDFLPGVTIVYSANVDGELEPCGCRTNPTGGLPRRWNLLEAKVKGETLTIDSGDLFYQSTPVPPFLEKQWNHQAAALLKAYNLLKLDAMTPGDLDLADGLDQFEKIIKDANFKIVSANLYRKDTGKRILEPYTIIKKGGKRVALFGLYDETLGLPPGIEARDHVAAAQEMVHELRSKADVVIALTHIGLDKDQELAKKVSGIDAIFGAHTQSFLISPDKVGDTLIFQPSFRGQHIGAYIGGKNAMYQVDIRFDSPPEKQNPLDEIVAENKAEVARLNKQADAEMIAEAGSAKSKIPEVQTFPRCAECHTPQYNFHKDKPHSMAYMTLVGKKQNNNLDCLKCHTVGMNQPGGWTSVNKLVLNGTGKAIDAESFAKSLPRMKPESFAKISKAFINVQCENCHSAAGEHPFSGTYTKTVATTTCLKCHTPDQAPLWYKDGKPNQALIAAKLKSMTCPRDK